MTTRYATDKQNAFIVSLVNGLTGKSFRFSTECPKSISRLSDGVVSEHDCIFGLSVEQASAVIDVLKAKLEAKQA